MNFLTFLLKTSITITMMSMKPATLSRFAQAAALISRRCVSSTAANAAEKIESKAVLTRADNL